MCMGMHGEKLNGILFLLPVKEPTEETSASPNCLTFSKFSKKLLLTTLHSRVKTLSTVKKDLHPDFVRGRAQEVSDRLFKKRRLHLLLFHKTDDQHNRLF